MARATSRPGGPGEGRRVLRRLPLLLPVAALALGAPARAQSMPRLVPPVDGAIARGWAAPASSFGPGHRGIDYSVPQGTLVRAAGAGVVEFAGPVAGVVAVTLRHEDGLETTYTSLAATFVTAGEDVAQGQWLGRAGFAHPGGATGLHFGVKLDGGYVDPSLYLGAVDLARAIHLAPTVWRPPDVLTEGFTSAFDEPGTSSSPCRDARPLGASPPPPNDNVAVAVAGIGSKTAGGPSSDMYVYVPELLGYPPGHIYRFSYEGARGPLLHQPYEREGTYGDLRGAAARLRDLLLRVAKRAPGRHVDLIAHSQGGIVARVFLESLQREWDPRLPVIDHLVTYSTPHDGAPLAGTISGFDRDTLAGGLLLDALSAWTKKGGPIPDPRSVAAAQLAPGSALIDGLGQEDVAFGTRVLALAETNDAVVPADHALYRYKRSRTVAPSGWNGHSGILWSESARADAYAFLRDAAPTCRTDWDAWGPRLGWVASWGESKLPWLLRRGEEALVGRVGAAALRAVAGKRP
jgi:Peptidase family M23/PGAP1-like protein